MSFSRVERINEIQRLRVLADLLKLYGTIGEDNAMTKSDIAAKILEIIIDNFLYEVPNTYLRAD